MELPADFIQNLYGAFGRAATDDWIARLPRLLAESASRWDLELGVPVDGLSYNYVCFATRPLEGAPCRALRTVF